MYCTYYFPTQAKLCYRKHVKRRRASVENNSECLCSLSKVNRFYDRKTSTTTTTKQNKQQQIKKKKKQALACVVLNFFVMRHLLISDSSFRRISRTKTMKLCLTRSTSLTSCLVASLVPTPQEIIS